MSTSEILSETVGSIRQIVGQAQIEPTIERVVVGLYFTGVRLSSGHVGACATPSRTAVNKACCPEAGHASPLPGTLRRRRALDLLDEATHPDGIRRAIGIATMNALGALCWDRRPHPDVTIETGIDAFAAADIQPGQQVVLVGAFVPFLRELKQRRQSYLVLERNPDALKPDEMPHYRPAAEAATIIPSADVLLVTGTTLINDTIDQILASARPDALKVVVGPTVGLVPDAYVRRGCDILGGIRVTQPDMFLEVLAEAGAGHHFFGRSAEKIVVRAQRPARMSHALSASAGQAAAASSPVA
ncbi:MAG: DUF364 domain-containing protein [Hyphomicrobiales bacterium]|nr:DUF364 domain-containing protein [Hyphomicrobiales bacterium]